MAIHAQYQGIEFDLDNTGLGTWDALEMMADVQDGNALQAVRFARLIFGAEQFERIKRELPDNSIATVLDFIHGAIEASAEVLGEGPKN